MYGIKHYYLSLFLVVIVSSKLSVAQDEVESRVVITDQGPVRGYKSEQHGIFEFKGIPYATAPTGTDKFKAPLPVPMWTETFDAKVNNTIVCPQILPDVYRIVDDIVEQNDCLIASIYVPDTNETNLPVLVVIHGGLYQFGWGDFTPPKSLVRDGNFIAVTFNYRLGIYGFLCLGTEEIPGNAGMKDMLAALRWVNRNIASFGGNPEDVTLTGYSAGSAATELFMLSETSRGLFNKVVTESGSTLAVWSVQRDPTELAKEFAKSYLQYETDDIKDLNDFYTSKPLDELVVTNFLERRDTLTFFVPCLERDAGSGNTEIFIQDAPVDIISNGSYKNVPILYGFTEMEGIYRLGYFDLWKDEMNEKFSDFLPADLFFETVEEKNEVAQTVKEFYFGDEEVSNTTMQNFIDYFGDVIFNYPIMKSVRMHIEAGHTDIHLYEYTYIDDILQASNPHNYRGATHIAQTMALTEFGDATVFSEDYKNVIKLLQELWTNFYKTGKPTSRRSLWPETSADGTPHMKFDVPSTLLESVVLENRIKFWDQIYEQYYWKPIPPRAT